jgi:hypothetical protein
VACRSEVKPEEIAVPSVLTETKPAIAEVKNETAAETTEPKPAEEKKE